LIGSESIEKFQLKTLDPHFTGAAVGPLSEVTYSNQLNYENFTLNVMAEILFSVPVVILFPKNFYLVNEINLRINIMHAAGLIDYWKTKYSNADYARAKTNAPRPKKLSLFNLSGGFYIWVGGSLLAFVVCVIEIVWARIKCYLHMAFSKWAHSVHKR